MEGLTYIPACVYADRAAQKKWREDFKRAADAFVRDNCKQIKTPHGTLTIITHNLLDAYHGKLELLDKRRQHVHLRPRHVTE